LGTPPDYYILFDGTMQITKPTTKIAWYLYVWRKPA
jgi:hypothetical protein